jgi:hypothetical protein
MRSKSPSSASIDHKRFLKAGKATSGVGAPALGRRLIQEEVVISLATIVELSHCHSVMQELI